MILQGDVPQPTNKETEDYTTGKILDKELNDVTDLT